MASIHDPFKAVDFSDLPALMHFIAKDGASLAYHSYRPRVSEARGSVVLAQGSSARSNSMQVLAKGFASAGWATHALDIRGHGASGPKGKISYMGQLEPGIQRRPLSCRSGGAHASQRGARQ